MNYTTYLFDFDYTLADSSRGIVTCFRIVLTRHGYTEVTDDDIKRTIGKTLEDSFSILTGITDATQLAGFKEEYRKEADTHMTVNTVLFLETKSVLVALKDSGARIGIISTKYRYRIKELLDQHFPANFMNIIVGGEDVKTAKPSPEGLLFALKQLHATKAETLYIGDSTVDAETAQAAGVAFAGVTHGVTTAKELGKYPHWKIMSTLNELLEDKEEKPSAYEIEKPVCPENTPPVPSREKKMISVWQTLLLLFLFWLAIEELDVIDSYLFPTLFMLALWGILQKRRILPDKARSFINPWYHPFKVRLRAFHIKLIRGKQTPPINNETNICLNCGTTYTGNYCNRCGQSRNTPRYRLSNALRNIAGGFFNIDSGFGRTLLELLYRPGYMIRDFIGGKRVEYFRPFQTLFILAALYIMTVQLVDPDALNRKEQSEQTEQEEIIAAQEELKKKMGNTVSKEKKEALAITIKSLDKSLDKIKQKNDSASATPTCPNGNDEDKLFDKFEKDTSEVGNKLERFLQESPFLLKVWNLLKSWGHGNKAFRIIATLPLFAIATQLAFRRRKYKLNYNTTEHIFIQAYIACQILLLSIVVLPFNGHAQVYDLYELPLWLIFVLFCWDYKQLYHCSWWKSFWRTILMLIYSLILLIASAAIVVALTVAIVYLLKFTL
ncbi:HAD-IA family hydrolase [Bacteroides fluxus]|jgi:phosphoglycolate phosphatase-like HAD superfamily hydrolase|uniref:HAD-IA family hydrolase n=1 Tax=Bacteroides fluxus TaxID=626930 RepID=UPI002A7EE880|nr:HAD-IA family hydrolase [Bacteroides fluxus]MDY3788302.1 HAD-IA family hydrolase [Bacteroides fluxus]